MTSGTNTQNKLYGFEDTFLYMRNLFDKNILPNKILFSGQKGIGKSTFAYHLANYIFAKSESNSYNLKDNLINDDNRSFRLVSNNIHPNFFLINTKDEKKVINIEQIREMINFTNKSSFNNDIKIILIDNVELLNISSVNALLKIIEEPNDKVIFFLIHDNQKNISDTLKSRCVQFKLKISQSEIEKITNFLTENDFYSKLNLDFKNHYFSPGQYFKHYLYCLENNIDYKNTNIDNFFRIIINNISKNKNKFLYENLHDYIELFFIKKIIEIKSKEKIFDLHKYFIKKIAMIKKYNLDFESLLIEFNSKLLNE